MYLTRMGFFANLPEVVSPLAKTISCFCKAADSVTRSAASSAVSWDTPSVNITPMETQQRSSLMAGQPGQRSLMAPSVQKMAKNFVLTTTSVEVMPSVFTPMVFEHISARTVALSPTMRSPGSAGCILDNCPIPNEDSSHSLSISEFLPYRDFSSTIVHRDPSMIADKDYSEFSDNIFLRIIHPYDTDAFEHFISKHDLTYSYSLLVMNLRHGFPLGEMPPLTDTVIFKNHPSALLHPDVIDKYLTDEFNAGHMSGPFSLQRIESILCGAIFCSPLLISIQIQQPGMPDKLRVCQHLSKGDKNIPSMNSHIHKEDFPTL